MKLLIIDGNNLAIRSAFANGELSANVIDENKEIHPDDVLDSGERFPTGVFHGFFRSIAMLKRKYPDHYVSVVWDGGNTRRKKLTTPAVSEGLIPEGYKDNRIAEEPKKEIVNFLKQKEPLRKAISLTNIPQIVVAGEEADDVAASYVSKYLDVADEIVLYTTDKDYYQLLAPNVVVLRDADTVTEASFKGIYGIDPKKWVDVGGFMGDDGDNIFGVPGWGEKTSIATIQQNGSFELAYEAFHKECDGLRLKYPDLSGDDLSALRKMVSPKGRTKYPDLFNGAPFTGVALAIENGLIKKPKSVINALIYEKRARLAMVLKEMVYDIPVPVLPGTFDVPRWNRKMEKEFLDFCSKFSLSSVSDEYELICGQQPEVKESVF